MSRRLWLLVAVVVPVLGVALLAGNAELRRQSGLLWRVPIGGYDPRDLLHGRFLRFRFEFDWQDEHQCGSPPQGRAPANDPDCCLCLAPAREGAPPRVRQVQCTEVAECDGWIVGRAVVGEQRYFVPEAQAEALERALLDQDASVELTTTPDGRPAIGELYLDGRPWREILRGG